MGIASLNSEVTSLNSDITSLNSELDSSIKFWNCVACAALMLFISICMFCLCLWFCKEISPERDDPEDDLETGHRKYRKEMKKLKRKNRDLAKDNEWYRDELENIELHQDEGDDAEAGNPKPRQ